jgi:hypothetical protein
MAAMGKEVPKKEFLFDSVLFVTELQQSYIITVIGRL